MILEFYDVDGVVVIIKLIILWKFLLVYFSNVINLNIGDEDVEGSGFGGGVEIGDVKFRGEYGGIVFVGFGD